jgi:hypothetical protein
MVKASYSSSKSEIANDESAKDSNTEMNDEEVQIYTISKHQQHNNEEEKKDSDIATVCHLCGIMVSGSALKWNGIEVIGALVTHLNNGCSYVNKYTVRVNEATSQWEKYLEGEKLKPCTDIRSFFSSCNEFFTVIA